MRQGGWVMWPLLALSLVSVSMTVERVFYWLATNRPGRTRLLGALAARLRAGDVTGARALIGRDSSIYARAVETLLDRGPTDHAAVEIVEGLRPGVERFSSAQSTIITAAPLLGILGTVTGIIQSFGLLAGMNQEAVSDPGAVAGGIAQALITTAFGLIVAMVALFPYAIFRAAADRCFSRLEALTAAASQGAPHAPVSEADRRPPAKPRSVPRESVAAAGADND